VKRVSRTKESRRDDRVSVRETRVTVPRPTDATVAYTGHHGSPTITVLGTKYVPETTLPYAASVLGRVRDAARPTVQAFQAVSSEP
jgi:hypothetical protein